MLIQGIIFLTGCVALGMLSQNKPWMRWGYIIGLIGQPFWLYTTIVSQQYGITAMAFVYAFLYGLGIYNYWVKY